MLVPGRGGVCWREGEQGEAGGLGVHGGAACVGPGPTAQEVCAISKAGCTLQIGRHHGCC